MELSVTYLWLIAGIVLLLAEAFGASGLGLLFAGLGALVVSALLNAGVLDEEARLLQFIVCFAATAAWAFLLWKPLQKFRGNKHSGSYSNMIGETAYVGSQGLTKGHVGEATWSGTIMKAELAAESSVDRLEGGAPVVIHNVVGNKLIVKPK
jgi:membrane protein implicated in regulation of membrane protease activity